MSERKPKVIVGLSGGVDSSVALIRLKEQGYDVEAMYMRNWDSAVNNDVMGNPDLMDDVCPQERDYQDAKKVAEQLGIKLHRVDFIEEYWNSVFAYFLSEYRKNRTPNPDILCNKEIKFKTFLDKAVELGADYIAMGHYARVIHDGEKNYLLRGVDENKDQSYFLSQLSSEQLAKAMFPIGDMVKPDVRALARKYNLVVADKKDSTGVCFIGERNFKEFLKNYIPAKPGKIIDIVTNKQVGEHQGVYYYTFGQRRGLNIGGIKGTDNKSWFVVKKDVKNNILYVATGDDNDYLMCDEVHVRNINLLVDLPKNTNINCFAKFRYRQNDLKVSIIITNNDEIIVHSATPLKAITIGQVAAFYDDNERLICSGIIEEVYKNNKKLELL